MKQSSSTSLVDDCLRPRVLSVAMVLQMRPLVYKKKMDERTLVAIACFILGFACLATGINLIGN